MLFLALSGYGYRVYASQLRVMRAATAANMAHATHGCTGAVDLGAVLPPDDASLLSGPPSAATAQGGDIAQALPSAPQPQARASMRVAHRFGLPMQTFVSGETPILGPFGAPAAATARASNLVLCNDVEHGTDPIGLFRELSAFVFSH